MLVVVMPFVVVDVHGDGTTVLGYGATHVLELNVVWEMRHDAYVVPQGGGFVLDAANMRQALKIQD